MAQMTDGDRRRFLSRVGGVAVLGLVAGCDKKPDQADLAPPMDEASGQPEDAAAGEAAVPAPSGDAAAGGGPVDLGKLADLTEGQGKAAQVNGKPVVAIREGEGVKAFVALCTHKSCTLSWDVDQKSFVCPCHGSTFDGAGKATKGPATEPLAEVPVKVEDGKILVG